MTNNSIVDNKVRNVLCRFGIHNWGKWEDYGNHLKQAKFCQWCNKKRAAYYLGGS